MAGMVYSVQLMLNVNSKQLDDAQRKLKELRADAARGINVREKSSGIRGTDRSGFNPFSRKDWTFRYSQKGFVEGMETFKNRWKTFTGNFFQNLFTISGWGRNLGNASRALFSFTGILGKAVPALGALVTTATALAKIWAVAQVGKLAINGLPLLGATRLLQSNSMGEAASNIMQMRMAEKGLGGYYKPALDAATEMAAAYGSDRVGMLNAINTFTGLPVNGTPLTLSQGKNLAQIAGKIAYLGGISFDRVNRNIQQLLAMAVPNMRDLNELTTQAPFISKLAQMRMRQKNVSGDYRDWLKDKVNLIETLQEFDKLVESNPLMTARGKLALIKQNFQMGLATTMEPYWDGIVKANERIYQWLGGKLQEVFGGNNTEAFEKMGDKVVEALDKLTDLIIYFGKRLLPKDEEYKPISNSKYRTVEYNIPVYTYNAKTGQFEASQSQFIKADKESYLDSLSNIALDSAKLTAMDSLALNKKFKEYSDSTGYQGAVPTLDLLKSWAIENKERAFIQALPKDSVQGYRTRWRIVSGYGPAQISSENESLNLPKTIGWTLAPDAIAKFFGDLSSGNLTGNLGYTNNTDETTRLSDLSNGSKALIINFNKEIINMPVNIASVGDVEDMANRLQPRIEESIIRGLEIALNNASGMS